MLVIILLMFLIFVVIEHEDDPTTNDDYVPTLVLSIRYLVQIIRIVLDLKQSHEMSKALDFEIYMDNDKNYVSQISFNNAPEKY